MLTFVAMNLVPKAGKELAEQKVEIAHKLVSALRAVNVGVSQREAEKMVEEILRNPEQVRNVLRNLTNALQH